MISSESNNNIKFVIGLRRKKHREEERCFFTEGYRNVTEAVSSAADIRQIYVSESFYKTGMFQEFEDKYGSTYQKSVELILSVVTDKVFRYISETETPQGIGIVAGIKDRDLHRDAKPGGNYVYLENIQDPGNLGTIIRTADAAGFQGVALTAGSVDPYNSKVLRSTAGSVFHMNIYRNCDTAQVGTLFGGMGYRIIGTTPTEGDPYFRSNIGPSGNVLLIGNEANGLTRQALEICNQLVSIPMYGGAESLNASVAAALIMYETVRGK